MPAASQPAPSAPLRIVALISGTGSTLRALLDAIEAGREGGEPLPAEVVAIGADRAGANLALAEERGIPSFVVEPAGYPDRAAWGDALLERVLAYRPDLTVLSGFMRLLPPRVVAALSPRLINQHPAYLPEFPGAHAVRDALAAGVTRTGASIIVVDDGVDTGPVLERVRVPIERGDTEQLLHERIKRAERALLIRVVRGIADGSVQLDAARASEPGPDHAPDGSDEHGDEGGRSA